MYERSATQVKGNIIRLLLHWYPAVGMPVILLVKIKIKWNYLWLNRVLRLKWHCIYGIWADCWRIVDRWKECSRWGSDAYMDNTATRGIGEARKRVRSKNLYICLCSSLTHICSSAVSSFVFIWNAVTTTCAVFSMSGCQLLWLEDIKSTEQKLPPPPSPRGHKSCCPALGMISCEDWDATLNSRTESLAGSDLVASKTLM